MKEALDLLEAREDSASGMIEQHKEKNSGVRNVSLVNIEKVAKGLKKGLPDLFSRV